MIQNRVKIFNNSDEINDEVAAISQCKYCTVKDIRILNWGRSASIKAQIIYDYDMEAYTKDHEKDEKFIGNK